MKLASALAILPFLGTSSAHYVFSKFVFNGQTSKDFEYVRRNTNNYFPTKFKNIPEGSISPESNDFRCNAGSFANAGNTKTASIKAGDEVGFQLAYGAKMEHPGPLQVYISKAPGKVSAYQGDGDWIKIHQELVCGDMSTGYNDQDWCTWGLDTKKFKIPTGTPDGEYLLRIEHIALHGAHDGQAEFYYTCAQLSVTGGGSGLSGPTAKIPGIYKKDSPEVNFSIWNKPTSYSFIPGIEVATGGSILGTANGKTGKATSVGSATGPGIGGSGNGAGTGTTPSSSQVPGSSILQPSTLSTKIRVISTTTGVVKPTSTQAQISTLPISQTSAGLPNVTSSPTQPEQPETQPGTPGTIGGKKYVCYEVDE